MAENESIQKWIGRNRPPRVQITYDVETYGAIRLKELPFVVGILADLTNGVQPDALKSLKSRKFIEVDRDNFDDLLAKCLPTVTLTVPNLVKVPSDAQVKAANDAAALVTKTQGEATAKANALTDAKTAKDTADKESAAADAKTKEAATAKVTKATGELTAAQAAADETAKIAKAAVDEAAKVALPGPENVSVSFSSFDDFKPHRVIQTLQSDLEKDDKATGKFKDLCNLYSGRQLLVDLLAKVDGNDVLAQSLKTLAADKTKVKVLDPASEEPKVKGGSLDKVASPAGDQLLLDIVSPTDTTKTGLVRREEQALTKLEEKNEAARIYNRSYNMLRQFILELNSGRLDEEKLRNNPAGAIQACIGRQDDLLTKQCNLILHHADFQRMEATWRGLHYLVMKTETGPLLKLKVLNVTKGELSDDFEKAADKDQSALFKKIYEEEYGTFGGYPFGLLVGDYYFGRGNRDVKLLENLSKVAAAAHAPMIAAADPRLFDWDSFTQLGEPRDLSKIFESTEMIPWNSYRGTEDSRYVALALPRFLLRLPYDHEKNPIEGFNFDERDDARTLDELEYEKDRQRLARHESYLWGNAAWALAQRITNAFALYRWCAAIRGFEGGGLVENLPVDTFKTDAGDTVVKCPTEIAITDRREKELDSLGFIALCHCKGTDYAAFFSGQMTQKPKTDYDLPDANANARISAMLPYMLAASRFAHYLKAIVREKVGSFYTSATLAEYLNRWIGNYVMGRDDAGQEIKAQYPLREARVDVTDVPGKPGAFKATAFLRPHFQLEELTTSIRLVASLPPPAA